MAPLTIDSQCGVPVQPAHLQVGQVPVSPPAASLNAGGIEGQFSGQCVHRSLGTFMVSQAGFQILTTWAAEKGLSWPSCWGSGHGEKLRDQAAISQRLDLPGHFSQLPNTLAHMAQMSKGASQGNVERECNSATPLAVAGDTRPSCRVVCCALQAGAGTIARTKGSNARSSAQTCTWAQ